MAINYRIIRVTWKNDGPEAPDVTIGARGEVFLIWCIEPDSGITEIHIKNLDPQVFVDQSSDLDGALFTSTDENSIQNEGTYSYSIEARHRDHGLGSHDPKITNNPT